MSRSRSDLEQLLSKIFKKRLGLAEAENIPATALLDDLNDVVSIEAGVGANEHTIRRHS